MLNDPSSQELHQEDIVVADDYNAEGQHDDNDDGMPENVKKYLTINQKITECTEYKNQLKANLVELKPFVSEWLQQRDQLEYKLNLSPQEQQIFGGNGKLRFVLDQRKEAISKSFLIMSLTGFFLEHSTQIATKSP